MADAKHCLERIVMSALAVEASLIPEIGAAVGQALAHPCGLWPVSHILMES
jgi:hypothetical protein